MFVPDHLRRPVPPPWREHIAAPPRVRYRRRVAAAAVHVGEAAIRLGWRLVDTGLAHRDGTAAGWLPQHARPPGR